MSYDARHTTREAFWKRRSCFEKWVKCLRNIQRWSPRSQLRASSRKHIPQNQICEAKWKGSEWKGNEQQSAIVSKISKTFYNVRSVKWKWVETKWMIRQWKKCQRDIQRLSPRSQLQAYSQKYFTKSDLCTMGKMHMKLPRKVLGHSLIYSLVCSLRSLFYLLARLLHCAHSLARSLTHSLPSLRGRGLCVWNECANFA